MQRSAQLSACCAPSKDNVEGSPSLSHQELQWKKEFLFPHQDGRNGTHTQFLPPPPCPVPPTKATRERDRGAEGSNTPWPTAVPSLGPTGPLPAPVTRVEGAAEMFPGLDVEDAAPSGLLC